MPWNWMLPIRLVSSWCVCPWITVTVSKGFRMRLHLRRRRRSRSSRACRACRAASARRRSSGVFLSTFARSCFSQSRCGSPTSKRALPVVVEPGDDRHALLGRVALGRSRSPSRPRCSAPRSGCPCGRRSSGRAPNISFHFSPMSRYQSCSPTIIRTGAFSSFRICWPSASSSARPSCARSPPKSTKSGCGSSAFTSSTAFSGGPREAVGHAARVEVRCRRRRRSGRPRRRLGARRRRGVRHVHELEACGRAPGSPPPPCPRTGARCAGSGGGRSSGATGSAARPRRERSANARSISLRVMSLRYMGCSSGLLRARASRARRSARDRCS